MKFYIAILLLLLVNKTYQITNCKTEITSTYCQECVSTATLSDDKKTCTCKTAGAATCGDAGTLTANPGYYGTTSITACINGCGMCTSAATFGDCTQAKSKWAKGTSALFNCPSNCNTCTATSAAPTTCDSNGCATSYYLKSDNTCNSCSTNCKTCSSDTVCTLCNVGYGTTGTSTVTCAKCAASCEYCKTSTVCFRKKSENEFNNACAKGYVASVDTDNSEVTCTNTPACALTGCWECSNVANKCNECDWGFRFVDGATTCEACPANCLDCTRVKTDCQKCADGYTLDKSTVLAYKCVKAASSGAILSISLTFVSIILALVL